VKNSFARLAAGATLAALSLGVALGSDRPPREGNVTLTVLGSAHDHGEIKPCG
jgi:hypothetical protein